jgi:hypothetical protein
VRPVNYCSYRCAAVGTGNLARVDNTGRRNSPGTEFKSGTAPGNKLAVGAERIRSRKGRGDVRRWVKVAEPNVWQPKAVVLWETEHGPIPAGMVVHHENHDMLDDRIENLRLLTRAEHAREHRLSRWDHDTTSDEK